MEDVKMPEATEIDANLHKTLSGKHRVDNRSPNIQITKTIVNRFLRNPVIEWAVPREAGSGRSKKILRTVNHKKPAANPTGKMIIKKEDICSIPNKPYTTFAAENQKIQACMELLVDREALRVMARKVTEKVSNSPGWKWEEGKIEAMQETCEAYMVDLMGKAIVYAAHHNRLTVTSEDIELARQFLKSNA